MKVKAIELFGWRFSRLDTGYVMIEKDRLVADTRLFGPDEWDGIIASLWIPRDDVLPDEHPEDRPEDEPS